MEIQLFHDFNDDARERWSFYRWIWMSLRKFFLYEIRCKISRKGGIFEKKNFLLELEISLFYLFTRLYTFLYFYISLWGCELRKRNSDFKGQGPRLYLCLVCIFSPCNINVILMNFWHFSFNFELQKWSEMVEHTFEWDYSLSNSCPWAFFFHFVCITLNFCNLHLMFVSPLRNFTLTP